MKTLSIILIAPDEKDVLRFREVVRETGVPFSLTVFPDETQALEMLFPEDFIPKLPKADLLVIDKDLHRINDMEDMLELKMVANLKDIPVLFLKTSTSSAYETISVQMLADVFVQKPMMPSQLFEALHPQKVSKVA